MKNIMVVLLVFILTSSIYSIEIGSSFAIRKPTIDNKPIDYQFLLEMHNKKSFYIDTETQRKNGEYFKSIELMIMKDIPIWKINETSIMNGVIQAKRVYSEVSNANLYQLDIRSELWGWSAGFAHLWTGDTKKPTQRLVFGKVYQKEVKLIGVGLFSVDFRTDFLTKNFNEYQHEEFIRISIAVSSILSVYLKSKTQYYSEFDWQTKLGISVKI